MFVSNSSSSSNIVRGVKIEMFALESLLNENIDTAGYDWQYEVDQKLGLPNNYRCAAIDEWNKTEAIIGRSYGDCLIDDAYVPLPDFDDEEIATTLAKVGIIGELKTFVQMGHDY